MSAPSPQELRPIDLFEGLDEETLADVAAHARVHEYAAGDLIAEDGQIDHAVYLLLDGTAATFTTGEGRVDPASSHVAPTWLGAIAAVTGAPLGVRVEAGTALRLAAIEPQDFMELAIAHRAILRRVLARVRPVVGRITAIEQNRERLESLGTMAAGLAHELNNPASAAKRSSAELAEALEVLGSTIGVFVESGLEREEAQLLVEIQRQALATAEKCPALGALDAADVEDELGQALADMGIADGWRLAEPLARAGVDRALLQRIAAIAGPATDAAVRWVAATLLARELAGELAESTERMSKLVAAVKTYAYMDRGGLVEIDLHEGIETTLTILGHKLKHTGIQLVRDYAPDLPRLLAYGAELNQVWTNLIDNAIDALGDSGTIAILTRRDGDCVEVEITDDGPGMTPDVRERVFDPFFTTKDVGRGTGLGLDAARRIVVDRHHGSITLDSQPGRTTFRVRLPADAGPP